MLLATTTSTSFDAGTGLKKCSPITSFVTTSASSVTDSDDVLVAITASGAACEIALKALVFSSIDSGTASTTRRQSAKSPASVLSCTRCIHSSAVPGAPRSIDPVTDLVMRLRAASKASSLMSTTMTVAPADKNACAIPAPIRPPPMTPTRSGKLFAVVGDSAVSLIVFSPDSSFYRLFLRSKNSCIRSNLASDSNKIACAKLSTCG